MKALLTLITLSLVLNVLANDGAFFASGNQLIPIEESDVEITKEILTIERINRNQVRITVDYTFNNPTDNVKEVLVGFEAKSPMGDVNGIPLNGRHPYMDNFSVLLNGNTLPYDVSIVETEVYYENGVFHSISEEEAVDGRDFINYADFYYVYHFNAAFEPGINKVLHEYIYQMSSGVDVVYGIDYVLTAANRWANKQIDDFTLNLELGDYTRYDIFMNFFGIENSWTGARMFSFAPPNFMFEEGEEPMRVYTDTNTVTFHETDFHPEGELSILALRDFSLLLEDAFNAKEQSLPFNVDDFLSTTQATDDFSYKILRNLPYARRGYMFKTPAIQEYYEGMPWYLPDPDYQANPELLSEEEQEWLKELKKNQE